MATRRIGSNPWPAQTPLPAPPVSRPKRSLKRRRLLRDDASASTSKSARRQVVPDQDEIDQALTECQLLSGNNIISCYPTDHTLIAQHQWTSFVWNSRRPQLTQTNLVDIYLFHGDSRQQILHFPNVQNPSDQAGRLTAQVNDSWWGTNGANWSGKNISYPFFWVIVSNGTTLDSNAIAQNTFSAVQTTYADSVLASMSSSSAALAASSSASLLSASASRTSSQSSHQPTSTAALQSSSGSDFPHWAIAVIVILGFLAIAATCLLAFLIIRRVRRLNPALASNRGSMGSASPMIANVGNPSSPLLGGGAGIVRHASISEEKGRGVRDEPSVVAHDAESTISRTGSAAGGGGGVGGVGVGGGTEAPFNAHDAAIMADAFRKMLRKPDFAGQSVEEGESPDGKEETEEMINRELAEEGRDIRSVRSGRGVKVETSSEGGGTVQDHGRE